VIYVSPTDDRTVKKVQAEYKRWTGNMLETLKLGQLGHLYILLDSYLRVG